MKKLICLILAMLMLLTALSGCGKAKGGDTDKNGGAAVSLDNLGNDPNANYEVSGTITVGINSYRNSDFEMLFNTFKSLYPNVKVEPIVFVTYLIL